MRWTLCKQVNDLIQTPTETSIPFTMGRRMRRHHLQTKKWAPTTHKICQHVDPGLPNLQTSENYLSVF